MADAARQWRPGAPAPSGARCSDWPWAFHRRHLVSPHCQHPRAAPLPRQGDHRARGARRALAGIHRNHRAPGTPGVSRPAVHAPQSGLRARPHVRVAVFHARMDPAAGRHHGPAGVDSPGARPALGVRGPHRGDVDVAARGRAIRAGAWGAIQSADASPVHPRHHRAARQGSACHRHRRAPRHPAPGGLGALVPAGGGRALGLGDVACVGVGRVWFCVRRRGGVRVVRPRQAGRCGAAGARRGRAAVGLHRRHRGRDWIPARVLDGRLAAARLARGLRRRRRRVRRSPGPRRVASWHPARPCVVRLPRNVARGAGRCVVDAARGHGGRGGRREWRRQDHACLLYTSRCV